MKITVLVARDHIPAVLRTLGGTPKRFNSLRAARTWAHLADVFASASCGLPVQAAIVQRDGKPV